MALALCTVALLALWLDLVLVCPAFPWCTMNCQSWWGWSLPLGFLQVIPANQRVANRLARKSRDSQASESRDVADSDHPVLTFSRRLLLAASCHCLLMLTWVTPLLIRRQLRLPIAFGLVLSVTL